MSAAASPLIGLPPPQQQQQQQQRPQTHHLHITDDSRHHHQHRYNHRHHHHHERQPLPPTSRKPTAAALRREKMAAGLATSRGAGGLIRLEIYMDLLCPWCFIEKHNLEALMQRYRDEHPEVRFEAVFRPYYIAPTMAKRMLISLFYTQILSFEDERMRISVSLILMHITFNMRHHDLIPQLRHINYHMQCSTHPHMHFI